MVTEKLEPVFIHSRVMSILLWFQQKFVDGHWVFECQHGEKECYGNKMQACAILQACGEQGSVHCSTDNVGKVLKYITCVEADPDQKGANDKVRIYSKIYKTPIW